MVLINLGSSGKQAKQPKPPPPPPPPPPPEPPKLAEEPARSAPKVAVAPKPVVVEEPRPKPRVVLGRFHPSESPGMVIREAREGARAARRAFKKALVEQRIKYVRRKREFTGSAEVSAAEEAKIVEKALKEAAKKVAEEAKKAAEPSLDLRLRVEKAEIEFFKRAQRARAKAVEAKRVIKAKTAEAERIAEEAEKKRRMAEEAVKRVEAFRRRLQREADDIKAAVSALARGYMWLGPEKGHKPLKEASREEIESYVEDLKKRIQDYEKQAQMYNAVAQSVSSFVEQVNKEIEEANKKIKSLIGEAESARASAVSHARAAESAAERLNKLYQQLRGEARESQVKAERFLRGAEAELKRIAGEKERELRRKAAEEAVEKMGVPLPGTVKERVVEALASGKKVRVKTEVDLAEISVPKEEQPPISATGSSLIDVMVREAVKAVPKEVWRKEREAEKELAEAGLEAAQQLKMEATTSPLEAWGKLAQAMGTVFGKAAEVAPRKAEATAEQAPAIAAAAAAGFAEPFMALARPVLEPLGVTHDVKISASGGQDVMAAYMAGMTAGGYVLGRAVSEVVPRLPGVRRISEAVSEKMKAAEEWLERFVEEKMGGFSNREFDVMWKVKVPEKVERIATVEQAPKGRVITETTTIKLREEVVPEEEFLQRLEGMDKVKKVVVHYEPEPMKTYEEVYVGGARAHRAVYTGMDVEDLVKVKERSVITGKMWTGPVGQPINPSGELREIASSDVVRPWTGPAGTEITSVGRQPGVLYEPPSSVTVPGRVWRAIVEMNPGETRYLALGSEPYISASKLPFPTKTAEELVVKGSDAVKIVRRMMEYSDLSDDFMDIVHIARSGGKVSFAEGLFEPGASQSMQGPSTKILDLASQEPYRTLLYNLRRGEEYSAGLLGKMRFYWDKLLVRLGLKEPLMRAPLTYEWWEPTVKASSEAAGGAVSGAGGAVAVQETVEQLTQIPLEKLILDFEPVPVPVKLGQLAVSDLASLSALAPSLSVTAPKPPKLPLSAGELGLEPLKLEVNTLTVPATLAPMIKLSAENAEHELPQLPGIKKFEPVKERLPSPPSLGSIKAEVKIKEEEKPKVEIHPVRHAKPRVHVKPAMESAVEPAPLLFLDVTPGGLEPLARRERHGREAGLSPITKLFKHVEAVPVEPGLRAAPLPPMIEKLFKPLKLKHGGLEWEALALSEAVEPTVTLDQLQALATEQIRLQSIGQALSTSIGYPTVSWTIALPSIPEAPTSSPIRLPLPFKLPWWGGGGGVKLPKWRLWYRSLRLWPIELAVFRGPSAKEVKRRSASGAGKGVEVFAYSGGEPWLSATGEQSPRRRGTGESKKTKKRKRRSKRRKRAASRRR